MSVGRGVPHRSIVSRASGGEHTMMSDNNRTRLAQALGFLGAALLVAGTFAPAVHAPAFDDSFYRTAGSGPYDMVQSYIDAGYGEQYIVIAIGSVGLLLAVVRLFKAFYFLGIAALGTEVYGFFYLRSKVGAATANINEASRLWIPHFTPTP